MHHGNEMPEEVRKMMQTEAEFEKEYVNRTGPERPPAFGGTGRFPEGSMGRGDEGEIAFGVASDRRAKKVFLNFGKPVSWIGSNPEQARDLARALWEHANKAEGRPTSFAELDASMDARNPQQG